MLSLRILTAIETFNWIDIPEEISVGIVHSNPALFRDQANDYSYPVRLVMTEKLKFVFNWAENHEASTKRSNVIFNSIRYPVTVYDDGQPVVSGVLELTEISELYVEFNIRPNIGLINTIGEKKLKTFLADKLQVIDVRTQVQSLIYDITFPSGPSDIDFQLLGAVVSIPFNTDLNTTVADMASFINSQLTWPSSPYPVVATAIGNQITLTAGWNGVVVDDLGNSLFLNFIPSLATVSWAFSSSSTTSAIASYQQWYTEMAAKQDVLWPDANYCFFPVKFLEPGIVDPLNVPTPYTDFYLNYFLTGASGNWLIPYRDAGNYQVIQSQVSPFLYAMYILERIVKTSGIKTFTCDNDYNEFQSVITRLCLFNNVATERTDFIQGGGIFADQRISQFDEIVDLVTKLPTETTVKEFVDAMCNLLNAQLFINNIMGECKFLPLESILADEEYLDWTNRITSAPVIKHPLAKKFKITFTYDGNDALNETLTKSTDGFTVVTVALFTDLAVIALAGGFLKKTLYYCEEDNNFYRPQWDLTVAPGVVPYIVCSDDLCDFFTTANEFDFPENPASVEIITIDGDVVKEVKEGVWKIPNTSTKITSIWQNPTDVEAVDYVTPFGIRFMMNRGMQPDDNGHDYPMGNYDNYDFDGNRIDEVSLSLYGEDGLFNRFFYKWTLFLQQQRQVDVMLNLSHYDLSQLDMSKQIKIENSYYLIKQLEVQYPLREEVKAILIKIEK